MRHLLVTLILAIGVLTAPGVKADAPLPGHLRSLRVPQIEFRPVLSDVVPAEDSIAAPPIIDGKLDDPVWRQAAISRGDFWVSIQNRAASNQTDVLVIMDANNLYFGFRLYDENPAAIQSSGAVRDVGLGYDDSITVQLDTFFNRRDISSFSLNPRGTQTDEIAGGRSAKVEWKGDWRGAAMRTEFGWSAEFAIPLAILNYKEGDTRFGANFLRYQSRTKEYSYWADITPRGLVEEMGQLTGLVLPSSSEKKAWTFMPFLLAGKNIPNKTGEIEDTMVTGGVDMRYQPRPDLTGMISLNPDFSQVEQAVTDISFSYSEKAVADNRPFFAEGKGYFGGKKDDNEYFYSNSIPDFDVGAKGFGRLGRTQFGVLATQAPDNQTDFVGRGLYEIDDTHAAIATLVGSSQPGFDNVLAVGQFRGRQASGLNYALDAAMTSTTQVTDAETPRGVGNHYKGTLGWTLDHWNIKFGGDTYDANYFPANALLADDLPGTRGATLSTGYYKEYSGAVWRKLEASVGAYYRETDQGLTQRRKWFASGSVEFDNDIAAGIYTEVGPYRPVTDTPGVFEDEVNHDRYYGTTLDFNTRSNHFAGGLRYDWGDLGGGPYGYLASYAWWRPINPVYLQLSAEREDSFGISDQLVFVGSWDITPEHTLAGRYIYQDEGNSYRLAYGHRARKGIDIFAVYNQAVGEEAEYSIKFVYTLQR